MYESDDYLELCNDNLSGEDECSIFNELDDPNDLLLSSDSYTTDAQTKEPISIENKTEGIDNRAEIFSTTSNVAKSFNNKQEISKARSIRRFSDRLADYISSRS